MCQSIGTIIQGRDRWMDAGEGRQLQPKTLVENKGWKDQSYLRRTEWIPLCLRVGFFFLEGNQCHNRWVGGCIPLRIEKVQSHISHTPFQLHSLRDPYWLLLHSGIKVFLPLYSGLLLLFYAERVVPQTKLQPRVRTSNWWGSILTGKLFSNAIHYIHAESLVLVYTHLQLLLGKKKNVLPLGLRCPASRSGSWCLLWLPSLSLVFFF